MTPTAPPAAAATPGVPPASTPIVYVVDDDPFFRDVLVRIFSGAGMQAFAFESGAALMARADFNARALLLLDMNMPGITGLELQAALREQNVALPVIFLTGASDVPMAVMAMRNGAFDFIEKPFDGLALIERVRHVHAICFGGQHGLNAERQAEYLARLETLTPREREVLQLMVTGASSKVIARELGGSFRTVEIHRGRVLAKMGAGNLAKLVRMEQAGASPGQSVET